MVSAENLIQIRKWLKFRYEASIMAEQDSDLTCLAEVKEHAGDEGWHNSIAAQAPWGQWPHTGHGPQDEATPAF